MARTMSACHLTMKREIMILPRKWKTINLPALLSALSFQKRAKSFWRPSSMEYAARKAKVAKYGQPDSRWTKCPELGSVVEGILSNEALKQDKVAYRSPQLWLEAAGPLVACLEKAHDGTLTLSDAIPMLQSSLMLMGDASQHHSSMRRKDILHHLNPQLKKLMSESDFSGVQAYLFGEDFGLKAKEKLDAAAALIYQQPSKGKSGFQGGYPCKYNWSHGVADKTTLALKDTGRRTETRPHQQRDPQDD